MNGIIVAGVEYRCRVCGDERTIYVKPRMNDRGRPSPALDGFNRLIEYECRECGQERVHIALEAE